MRRMRGLALLVIFTAVGILYATVSGISAENVTLTLGSWRVDDV